MDYKFKDMFLLVISASASAAIFVLIVVFVRKRFSGEWEDFIYMCIIYLIVLIYIAFSPSPFKHLRKTKILLFQITYYILTVGATVIVFKCDVLPMPKGWFMYVAAMTMLAATSLIVLDQLSKRLRIFKK